MTETWEQGVLNVPRRRGKVMSLTQMYESMENHQPMTSGLQEIWGARPKCRHWIRVAFMALKGKSGHSSRSPVPLHCGWRLVAPYLIQQGLETCQNTVSWIAKQTGLFGAISRQPSLTLQPGRRALSREIDRP